MEWFKKFGRSADADMGMWKVKPEFRGNERDISILHLDTFLCGAHLLPVFGTRSLPVYFHFLYSLDAFWTYFVNKYIDHHAHEITS